MVWVIIIMLVVILDQVSKFIVSRYVGYGDMIPVIDKFFYITYTRNKGAAWGILQNGRYFFIAFTLIAAVVLAYMLIKNDNKVLRVSLSFILGGAAGNLIDRVMAGSVVDFLDFYFGTYNFPTFNIADSFVVIGSFILAYYMLFIYKDKEQKLIEGR